MRNRPFVLSTSFVLLCGAGIAAPARGDSASLLLDIRGGQASRGEIEVQGAPLSLGPVALVPILEESSGREPWVTDGTETGTHPLLDLCPGPCSSHFTALGVVRQVGIFTAYAEFSETPRLWRSDGTRAGTFPLGPAAGGSLAACGGAAPAGAALLFGARAAVGNCALCEDCALWKTDGTLAGTVKLAESGPNHLTSAGQLTFFVTFVPGTATLWRTDGSAAGTIALRAWPAAGAPAHLVAVGSRLFFTAAGDGRELWTSDGTAAGTLPLTGFGPADPFVARAAPPGIVLQATGTEACFLANDGVAGRELWCSDGTAAGTRPATSLATASPFLGLAEWRVERLAGRLLFPANDGVSGNRWWTSDGRPQSTAPLSGCPGGCPVVEAQSPLVRVGGQLFFAARGEGSFDPDEPPTTDLWVTDGTAAGTRRVADFCSDCRVDRMFPLLGKLFFSAGRHPFSYDLWASDGTAPGTRRLVSVEGFAEEVLPYPPVAVAGRALLAQGDRTAPHTGLWTSDGTPAGTEPVVFLGNGISSEPEELVPTSQGVRFTAGDDQGVRLWESRGTPATTTSLVPAAGPRSLTPFGALTLFIDDWRSTLWRTDGTEAGTFQLTPEEIGRTGVPVVVGSRALFIVYGQNDSALWSTDGTLAGTQEVAEFSRHVQDPVAAGTSALLMSGGGANGRLWWTDGTPAGTREIPLPLDNFQTFGDGNAARLGNVVFFHAYDASGPKLWRTDGTAAGTYPTAVGTVRDPGDLVVHRGALYFVAGSAQAPAGPGLWRSDGTDTGTALLRTLDAINPSYLEFVRLTPLGDLLLVTIVYDDGIEIWRSDGTPEGTLLVRDIAPARAASLQADTAALDGRMYFVAGEPEHGLELWQTDGTFAGTRLVQDIAPGALSSAPRELVAAAGRLYFTADDHVHGREPWVYTPGGESCVPSELALCLGGGRFKVEADWRAAGGSGRGRAVSLTPDTGYFWFFDAANVEVILKVLDGRGVNAHHWVFYGALSDVEYALTVTDTQTGAARRYFNRGGRLGSVADTRAFGPLGAFTAGTVTVGPEPVTGEALVAAGTAPLAATCAPSATRLCLNGGRFAVEARWKDFQGQAGAGQAVPLAGGDTGYFWFFGAGNVEVVLKVLDGRPLNGKFWVFYGALSTVEYTLTVTDTQTGAVKTYTNPTGRLASVADTAAF